ncbi:hypothetical protein CJD44_17375 [Streptomyces sp. alain-838]|nr:hypothetical protein [Streptomyces sp. alain-838]PAK25269.1 hypothetical protein CJD44_17375 [Streptomyces sp. alain-838]
MTQSGQGEEPSPRQAREGIVLPSDGGEPLLPGLTGASAPAGPAPAPASAPPADTWVTVTGTWHPEGALGSDAAWPPVLDATDVRRVEQPANPYEKR